MHALLFATESADGRPTALLPLAAGTTVVEDLAAKLADLDVDRITVVSRPEWADELRSRGLQVLESKDISADLTAIRAAAQTTTGSIALLSADILGHRAALNRVAGPRARRVVAAIQAGPAYARMTTHRRCCASATW